MSEGDLQWNASRAWSLRFATNLWDKEQFEQAPVISREESVRAPWPQPAYTATVKYKVQKVKVVHTLSGLQDDVAHVWKVEVIFICHKLRKDGALSANVNGNALHMAPAEALAKVTMPDEIRAFIEQRQFPATRLQMREMD